MARPRAAPGDFALQSARRCREIVQGWARCTPSTSTFTVPSGSLSICRMLDTQPISNMSSGFGSSLPAAFCATSMIWRPASIAASSALIDFGRPTNSGITMCGNTTTSRSGSSGNVIGSGGSTGMSRHGGILSFSGRCEARANDCKTPARRIRPTGGAPRSGAGLGLFPVDQKGLGPLLDRCARRSRPWLRRRALAGRTWCRSATAP
jgi:hypothetical protein